jgi:hypothetical protein
VCWEVWRESAGTKCGGMFGGKLLVESVVGYLEGKCWYKVWWDVLKEGVGRKCGGINCWRKILYRIVRTYFFNRVLLKDFVWWL